MSDISFECPQCQSALEVEEQDTGDQAECPKCHCIVTVPHGEKPPPIPDETPRPASVTTFGILNIVFGGLALLCTPFSAFAVFSMPNEFNPAQWYKGWLIFSSALSVICSAWLLALGIGLLCLKRWSRTGSIVYAWITIVFGVIGMVINFAAMTSGGISMSPETSAGFIGGLFGGLIGLVYPILLLIFMKRKPAVESCTR